MVDWSVPTVQQFAAVACRKKNVYISGAYHWLYWFQIGVSHKGAL